jgi:hypothetical protein
MAQVIQGRARRCARQPKSGQPKTQRTDANVDFVRSERRVGVRVIAQGLNMNRETRRQIVK